MPRFHVQRSTEIKAAPEQVYERVADFGTWTTWSPWLCAEPNAEVTVSDDPSSVGSTYAWTGEIVGEGIIEHRRLEPGNLIEEEIRFIKPFRSTSQVRFEMRPVGEATEITWHMDGSLPWFLFWMRSSMEFFIGSDYERGLRMLKEWMETGQILSKTTIQGVESVGPLRMAGIRKKCPLGEIGPSMEAALAEAKEEMQQHNLPMDCHLLSVYHDLDVKTGAFDYTSGFAIPESAPPVPEGLSEWSIPACQSLCVEHIGSYRHLGNAWSAAHQHARYKKLKLNKAGSYEIYVNDPENTPEAELCTRVILPLK